jgi:hypothetical protein
MSINRKTLPILSGKEVVTDRSSGSVRLLCAARNVGLEMSVRHPLDTHRNLHAGFTGTHDSTSKITSSGKDGNIVDDAIVVETQASFL